MISCTCDRCGAGVPLEERHVLLHDMGANKEFVSNITYNGFQLNAIDLCEECWSKIMKLTHGLNVFGDEQSNTIEEEANEEFCISEEA